MRSKASAFENQQVWVSRIFVSWNQIGEWLRRLDAVRRTA